jgi:hypothetical protein
MEMFFDRAERQSRQAVLESSTRDRAPLNAMAEELRALPWTESVDWLETEAEAE